MIPLKLIHFIILKTILRSYSDFSGIQIARNTTECEHLEIPKYPSTIAGFLNEKRFHIPFDDVTDLINIEQSCTAFVFPYMNIDLSPILKSRNIFISKVSQKLQLYMQHCNFVIRSPYVKHYEMNF